MIVMIVMIVMNSYDSYDMIVINYTHRIRHSNPLGEFPRECYDG